MRSNYRYFIPSGDYSGSTFSGENKDKAAHKGPSEGQSESNFQTAEIDEDVLAVKRRVDSTLSRFSSEKGRRRGLSDLEFSELSRFSEKGEDFSLTADKVEESKVGDPNSLVAKLSLSASSSSVAADRSSGGKSIPQDREGNIDDLEEKKGFGGKEKKADADGAKGIDSEREDISDGSGVLLGIDTISNTDTDTAIEIIRIEPVNTSSSKDSIVSDRITGANTLKGVVEGSVEGRGSVEGVVGSVAEGPSVGYFDTMNKRSDTEGKYSDMVKERSSPTNRYGDKINSYTAPMNGNTATAVKVGDLGAKADADKEGGLSQAITSSNSNTEKIDTKVETLEGNLTNATAELSANRSAQIDLKNDIRDHLHIEKLLSVLKGKIDDQSIDPSTAVKLRLLYTLLGDSQKKILDNKITSPQLEKLSSSLAELALVLESRQLSPAEQANKSLDIMNKIQEVLREEADLKISDLKLCSEVESFGTYKTLPEEYFVAGRLLPVIVYVELENFTSRFIQEKNIYETLLSMTIELIAEKDNVAQVLWRHHDENIKDISRKKRRDFYIARLITLPANLPTGELKLKVTIEDHYGNKVSQRSIQFSLKGAASPKSLDKEGVR